MENKGIISLIVIAALCLGTFGTMVFMPEKEVIINNTVIEYVDNVTEIVTEIPVDNGNLDLVLRYIYDNDDKVEALTNDLDDDEIESIVDRIVFLNEIKSLAVAEVKAKVSDELDKESFNETEKFFDEDDLERIRVQDYDDEVITTNVDFEDKDADVTVMVRFEQDDVKYEAEFNVEIKDGEVDDLDLIKISLH